MSYIRWGERGSDVYIYPDANGGITCCGCSLVDDDPESFNAPTYEAMIAHIGDHLAAGHCVPLMVIGELRTDELQGRSLEPLP